MNQIATIAGSPMTALVPTNMSEAMQLAQIMSKGKLVPKHLQDSPGDCLMVIEQAMRWGMSPFAVAQKTSVIQGKLMYEGQLVAAAIESSGAISGWIDYQYDGEGHGRAVIVSATRRGETEAKTVRVTLADAKTENRMWTKQPDQQLAYHGARVWGRRWTPSVLLGVYVPEEMSEPREVQATVTDAPRRQTQTLDHALGGDTIPDFDAAAPAPKKPGILQEVAASLPPKPKQTPEEWAAQHLARLRAHKTVDERNDYLADPKIARAMDKLGATNHALWQSVVDEDRGILQDLLDADQGSAAEPEDIPDLGQSNVWAG